MATATHNQVLISGNVSNIVENQKINLVTFDLATPFKDKDGKDLLNTSKVKVFGDLATKVKAGLNAKDRIYIEGKLRTESFDGKNGTVYQTFIVAKHIERL